MKKLIILLVLCLSFVLVSCGTPKKEMNPPKEDPTEENGTEQPTVKPDAKKEGNEAEEDHKAESHKSEKPDKLHADEKSDSADKKDKPGVTDKSDKPEKPSKPTKPNKPTDDPKPAPAPEQKPKPEQKPSGHEHHYTSKKVPATCTKGGYTKHTCSCGESYISDKTEPLGHQYGSWKTTKAPTYESKGAEQRTCSRCGKTQTRSIPKKARPQLDFDKLCKHAINYAVDTYGYEYWPGMRDGYYPAYTCYITNMEEGYSQVRACVDALTETLEARGSHIVEWVDGKPYGMPFDIEIYPDPDGFEDYYCVQLYY